MDLVERDKRVIWHPFTQQKNSPAPIPIIEGKGPLLIDDRGNSYIDSISSWWVNLHGHSHPYIAKKLYEQALKLEQVIFAGFTHEPAIVLAERLLEVLPGHFSRLFYSDNGSTSTEVAVKMALQFWWNKEEGKTRNKILAFKNSYHGDTFGAMSVSDRSVFTKAFHEKLFEVDFIDAPSEILPIPDLDWSRIACVIYEPLVQGAGGMKMYSPKALDKFLQKCKENKVITIADEVMTGFGRTGKIFASDYCTEKPSIICLSKGLTGGTMALGITACVDEIYQAFFTDDKLKTFFHGHSFTANPLACTTALASLDLLMEDTCWQNIHLITEQNQHFATKLLHHRYSGRLKNIRTLGTILAFEIEKGEDDYLNPSGMRFTEEALKRGVFIRPLGNTVYIMPPYCITKAELQIIYLAIEEILALT